VSELVLLSQDEVRFPMVPTLLSQGTGSELEGRKFFRDFHPQIVEPVIIVDFHRQANVAVSHVDLTYGGINFGPSQMGTQTLPQRVKITGATEIVSVWDPGERQVFLERLEKLVVPGDVDRGQELSRFRGQD
jgi:hypothetical protein